MTGRSLHILWVEDHPDTALAFAKLMHAHGHKVTTAFSLTEAREAAAQDAFDLLVADIILPDGSGLLLPRLVREGHPGLPCIAVSADGMREEIECGLTVGFDHYLVKPIVVEELMKIVEGIARAKNVAALTAASSGSSTARPLWCRPPQ